jgi:hypothetical protein
VKPPLKLYDEGVNLLLRILLLTALSMAGAGAQVIEFESNGLKYQTLTKNGVTIMFAIMPSRIKGFTVLQVAVNNGSRVPCTIDPEEFIYRREDGSQWRAMPARQVVRRMLDRANRDDVMKMVGSYELGLYGLSRIQSTNGYEQRRQSAIAEFGGSRLKAAAAASAIAMVKAKLEPGESTDGAIFYPNSGKLAGEGRVSVKAAGELFEFDPIKP